jgi:hypothetical protein
MTAPARAVTLTLRPYDHKRAHAFVVTLTAPLPGVLAEVESIHLYRPQGTRVYLRRLDLDRLPALMFAQLVQLAWLATREGEVWEAGPVPAVA